MLIDEVKSILVVDDEEDLREILRFELEDQGYSVLEAKGVDNALSILEEKHVDVVISDIRMPEKSGIELLTQIRSKHYNSPPLIFMSGFADISTSKAFHLGAAGVFSKPIDMQGLLNHVKKTLQPAMEQWKKLSDWDSIEHSLKQQTFESLKAAEDEQDITLGHGGMFLKCSPDQFPALNSKTRFEIRLNNPTTTIKGIARCRWQRQIELNSDQPSGIGIEFLELADSSIVFLTELMKEDPRKAYIPGE